MAFLDVGDGLARPGFVNGNELKMKHAFTNSLVLTNLMDSIIMTLA